jgi:hypothetical protein
MVPGMKGQFYFISILVIALVVIPILINSYFVTYTYIDRNPQSVRENINSALRSLGGNATSTNLALAAGNRDILLALDTAGGLGVNFEDVKNSSKLFLECADMTDRVSLFQFPYCPSKTGQCNCNTSQLSSYLYLTSGNKAYLDSLIDGFEKFGKDPIATTLIKSGSIISSQADQTRNRVMILLSTGPENCGGDIYSAVSSIPQDVPVYTIGYKIGASGEQQLEYISNATLGQYFYADTGEDLRGLFCSLGQNWEARIKEFLTFIQKSIKERMMNLTFDVRYGLSLATTMIAETNEIDIRYKISNPDEPISGVFHYEVYANASLVTSENINVNLTTGDVYQKEIDVVKQPQTNYTSVSYLTTTEIVIRNQLKLPYTSERIKLDVRNVIVTYNVSVDGTFVMDTVVVPTYIYGK